MCNRRHFVLGAIPSIALYSFSASSRPSEQIEVEIRGDQQLLATIPPIQRKSLSVKIDNSEDAKILSGAKPPSLAAPVIVIIAGAILLAELHRLILELIRQRYYGGVIIDTRTRPSKITSDLKIPANLVVIIDKDGKTHTFNSSSFSVADLKDFVTR